MSADKGFLGRWSSRKRGQDAPTPDEAPAPPPRRGDGGEDLRAGGEVETARPEKTDAELLAEHGLPDPDALKPGDDFSGFMNSAIPTRLRNRALRKLWLTNPVLANIDELVDYGEDFTDAATVVENLQTVYQVGKGMLVPEPDPEEIVEGAVDKEGQEAGATDDPEPASVDEPVAVAGSEPAPAAFPSPPEPRPRRMRFDTGQG